LTDRELLDQLRGGSQDAFQSIFRACYARLVGLAGSMLRDGAAAEEIVQDVMLELWRRRETLVIETTLQAYLYRATRNRSLNRIRHERIAERAQPYIRGDAGAQPHADAGVVEAEIDAALRSAVSELPARCREVFELSRVHGLTYAEIAQTMEISVKTVEAQMGKALRILRERLAPWLPGGGLESPER
jgi:RNA polymerase sigma-70 factor (ECF subfamily)